MTGALGIERRVLLTTYGRWAWVLRTMPWHSVHWLGGIQLPPHERQWIRNVFADYKRNDTVASRGTSKSFTKASLSLPMKALLRKNVGGLIVSASGFRGSKLLMDDSERLVEGKLRSQRLPGPFLINSIGHNKVIKRDVDRWTMVWKSQSQIMSVPSNNPDNLRGIRATIALIDERNFMGGNSTGSQDVVRQVIVPMLNVGSDFENTAAGGDKNQLFQVSTIDYTIREWYQEVEAMRRLSLRQYEAQQALAIGDHQEYKRLMEEDDGALKTFSYSYSRVDYTDVLLPEYVTTEEGKRFKVNYPLPKTVKKEGVLKWVESWKQNVYFTYPVDLKGLEDPLRNGTMDRDLWLAEQRNIPIAAAGTVYPLELIKKCAESAIYREGQLKEYPNLEDYFAPVLYQCGDPCVIGLDYARESDYFAIVVIRLGELAEGKFDPFGLALDKQQRPCFGKTPWNNVIWAEAHQKWTAPEAAEKIRELYSRYNVLRTIHARGMGMDKGGGGTAVRDQLAKPQPTTLANGEVDPNWMMPVRIFDPDDEDYAHYAGYDNPSEYWGGLELLKPTNFDNIAWTGESKGLMQASKLYLGYFVPPSIWAAEKGIVNGNGDPDEFSPEYMKWRVGYDGVRRLKSQLLRLQAKTSEAGVTRFIMPGDREKDEGKKDLYSAFIYAAHMAQKHLANSTRKAIEVPLAAPVMVDFSQRANDGDNWFVRLGL